MRLNANQAGVTLLEVMLVLAICSAILMLGISFYNSQQLQQNEDNLTYNVNTQLQSLGQYYHAYCNNTSDTVDSLNPTINTSINTSTPFPITVTTLQNLGFINLNNLIQSNPLVDNTSSSTNYILQFNPHASTAYQTIACAGSSPTQCPPVITTTPSATVTNNLSVLYWTVQVGVKLFIPSGLTGAQAQAQANAYKNTLGADCLSSTDTGGSATFVTPCSQNPPGNAAPYYLVFERLPSFVSGQTASSLWQTMPTINQFNLQYTHDQNYEHELSKMNLNTNQLFYYLCGG